MTVIFKDFDIEALIEKIISDSRVKKFLRIVKSNRILVRLTSICLIGLIALSISIVSTGITVGFEVKYGDKTIATVASAKVYKNAEKIAVQNVNSKSAQEVIETPKFSPVLTVAENLEEADDVATSIIENTSDIISAAALVVNGKTVVLADKSQLETVLAERLNAYNVENAENTNSFVDDVKVEEGYYIKSDIKGISDVEEAVIGLAVKTVSTFSTEKVIKYTTQKVKTDSQSIGYRKVTKAGANGLMRTTKTVESVNGEEVNTTVIADEVINEPITEIITIGTGPVTIPATETAGVSSKGFICPLKKGTFDLTAGIGDGRKHGGLDLAADKGEAIFAAADGKVIEAKYNGAYGYNVVIDHGNGVTTRYAHASALCVKAGQTVSQGDMIAAVGNTGRSTGNHLHFEIVINGTRVNPAPYIGLK